MTPITALIVLVAFCTLLTIVGKYRSTRLLYVFKPLTIALIIAVAWTAGRGTPDRYFWLVIAGLAFSAVGDVLLMLPRDRFVAGLASFLIAHLLYIAAFSTPAGVFAAPLLALPFFGAAAVLLLILLPRSGALAIPVTVYGLAIATMGWQAATRWWSLDDPASLCALLGAVLFMLSDSVLALNRFYRRFAVAEAFLLSTYFAGQTLIALSV